MNFKYGLMQGPRTTFLLFPLAMLHPLADLPLGGKRIQALYHHYNNPEINPSHFTGKMDRVLLIQSFVHE